MAFVYRLRISPVIRFVYLQVVLVHRTAVIVNKNMGLGTRLGIIVVATIIYAWR